jgi:hypothetical protein
VKHRVLDRTIAQPLTFATGRKVIFLQVAIFQ